MDANQIETLITQAANARKSCETADDNWIGYLKDAREQALRVAVEMEQQRRLADHEKARLKTEIERSRAELRDANLELAKVRKDLERERREIGMERQKLLNPMQSWERKVA
jgi:hypothetical protein